MGISQVSWLHFQILFLLLFLLYGGYCYRTTIDVINTLPAADQVQKLNKKIGIVHLRWKTYSLSRQIWHKARIQLNDKFATVQDVALRFNWKSFKTADFKMFKTTIRDWWNTNGSCFDIKQELRKVNTKNKLLLVWDTHKFKLVINDNS